MNKRIIISVTSDLATDQRVLKTADTCHRNGYRVRLVGRKLPGSLPLELPFAYNRMKLLFRRSAFFYAEYNIRLFFLLLVSPCDLLFCNDTDSLPANFLVAKLRKKKLVFDAHELFPEVPELQGRPRTKKIWESIEKLLFPHLKYALTVSASIANYYKQNYGLHMRLLRNLPLYFPPAERPARLPAAERMILYQGALNVGRGLDWVIEAMPFVSNARLVIVGSGSCEAELRARVAALGLEGRVSFEGNMPPEQLRNFTPRADIGLCLLEARGLSYYYALPNRIFDYLQAGVPVLATDFPEIAAVVRSYRTGVLVSRHDPQYLADTINAMLENPLDTSHFAAAAQELCWEREEEVLLNLLNETD